MLEKGKKEKEENDARKRFCSLVATNMATLTSMLADTQIFDAVKHDVFLLGTRCNLLRFLERTGATHLSGTAIRGFPGPGISIYYRLTQYLFTPREISTFCCAPSCVAWREKKDITIFPARYLKKKKKQKK